MRSDEEPGGNKAGPVTPMASFLDPGFDFTREELGADEAQRYLDWCARVHGEGTLELVPFAEFFVDFDPQGLKRLRRHTGTIGLPVTAAVFMWAHTYCVMGFEKGVLYEIIAARELGATRQEVVELLRIAGFFGGPFALNAAGEWSLRYLREWEDDDGDEDRASSRWPTGWVADPDAFRSGIDHRSTELLPGELDLIRDWYDRVRGGMPHSLDVAAMSRPSAFKMARVRFERLPGEQLPVRLVPLLMIHLSVIKADESLLRQAVPLAHFTGSPDDEIFATVHWASVFGGEWTMHAAFETVTDMTGNSFS